VSTEGAIWGAVILAVALVLAAWLLSTDGYERCMAIHSDNVERCRNLYPSTPAPAGYATPALGGPNR
jgi:hypothetical protein